MLAYAGVLRLTRWCRQNSHVTCPKRWRITACMRGNILYRLIYSGVLRSAQFYLFKWLFWRTPSTLKIAKSSPPQDYFECFNCLPFSLRNHFSKLLFSGMRSEHQTVWILIRSFIFVGPDLGSKCVQSRRYQQS